jgi:hypothetical protein
MTARLISWTILSIALVPLFLVAGVAARVVPAVATPTFATDVAPIIYTHCGICHRPGQAAPFSLLSYEDVKKRGKLIVAVTARRYMPPWHATDAPGFAVFRDDRRLSDAQIETLKEWVDGGMLPGDLARAPAPPTFPAGWALGEPDLVVSLPTVVEVPASGPDLYRNRVLTVDLPEDRWIAAIDFEPSARSVVHHALFFIAAANQTQRVRDDDILPGAGIGALAGVGGLRRGRGGAGRGGGNAVNDLAAGLGGWVPGMTPRFFPSDVAQPLPSHSNIVVQLHLHPTGKPEREQGRLAIYFAKRPPAKSLSGIQVPPAFGFASGIEIPAGEAHFTIADSFELPVDVEAFGARGHAHYLAREMKLTATLPDGSVQGLLWISDWDFGWQDSYFYKTPFTLPKGTRIHTEITYDNSAANLRNPNAPPKRVAWGLTSFDEMGSMTLLVAVPSSLERAELRAAERRHLRQQLISMFTGRVGQ